MACLIHDVYQGWKEKLLSGALFINVRGAFDHINPTRLVKRLGDIGIDRDLIY